MTSGGGADVQGASVLDSLRPGSVEAFVVTPPVICVRRSADLVPCDGPFTRTTDVSSENVSAILVGTRKCHFSLFLSPSRRRHKHYLLIYCVCRASGGPQDVRRRP